MSPSIQNLLSLEGKTVLISGASSGLGAHFAEIMTDAGAEVIVAARRVDKLQQLVETLIANGGKAQALEMDVTDADSVNKAFAQLDGMIDSLDILVNNAGISSAPTRFTELDEDDWGYVLDVNLKGAWRVAKHAAIRMKASGKGSIINTGSIYSLCTGLLKADYNVSKAAIAQLTKNMALELSRYGVRVNSLYPGYFASAINESEFSTERGKAYIARLVPQRLGEFHELNGPLLLLASDAGSYMTGTSLVVDGGSLLSPI
ncbi:SDR family oxidoreductase [Aestuariicella hydrocarbonica]|uniref:SDR family oxidoreductase n=1 Tax=Pseudomaricurvus hydrocarbonicus TaxID=1470433 RepID=A0A9E5MNB9_9GAMM|nr:SDR family oxidoreductase [Aestuariicella hydrocarbonica]NHO67436.1 SDR family oxidoreductase [Aestuariicella hydrocarbonica]